jgi:alpha-galactosidase
MSLRNTLAPRPPMGWNSWDCFGTTVTEREVKANALFMAEHLREFGWNTIVVDIQWYEPDAKAGGYRDFAPLIMDNYGRLLPAPNRFPSAKDRGGVLSLRAADKGFKPLADFLHKLDLKFGIHVMRGIPRQAVAQNLPILESPYHAQDIADTSSPCPWNTDMFGLNMAHEGAQIYLDSLAALYASWEVDFIKADDMLYPYHAAEIAGFSKALANSSRDILLSLSPGVDLDIAHAEHLKNHSELWRISADFWDRWQDLYAQFDLCAQWSSHIGAGHWPDADMLPLGHIGIRAERGIDRQSLLSHEEQVTLMSLWAMARSPLMFGGDLPSSSPETIALMSNPEILAINQASKNNHELLREGEIIFWLADAEDGQSTYLACFNRGDTPQTIGIDLAKLGLSTAHLRDLWKRQDLGQVSTAFQVLLNPHSAAVYRLKSPS